MIKSKNLEVYNRKITVDGILSQIAALLKTTPQVLKWTFLALFLVNIRSWPLVWHYKVLFVPIYSIRARYWLFRLRTLPLALTSPSKYLEAKDHWLQSLCPVGKNPFDYTIAVDEWAAPDDCDFNMHLSNSCYPKVLDSARFKVALKTVPTFFRAGGWMPLGATHFKFIKEIPIFAKYQIRSEIVAWDEKWFFVVSRYVTLSKKGDKKGKNALKSLSSDRSTPSGDSAPFPQLHTPAADLTSASTSGVNTPYIPSAPTDSIPVLAANKASKVELLARLARTEEPDGATLHCICVSELCFKVGRITVPPAVVLASEGFTRAPTDAAQPYTLSNPPPHWAKSQALQKPDLSKGHLKTLQTFFKGGWRDVPEEERWWVDALGEEVEERRRRNLELVEGVRLGMEGVRACV